MVIYLLQAALKSPKQVYSDYASRADASITLPDLTAVMKLYEERMPSVPGLFIVLYCKGLAGLLCRESQAA